MSAVVKAPDGRLITKFHGLSDYCKEIQSSPEGYENCNAYRAHKSELGQCHGGLYDFVEPIKLPDGTLVANILCGQIIFPEFKLPDFHALAEQYSLDEEKLAAAYKHIPLKDPDEVHAAQTLLSSVVKSFVSKSYSTWLQGDETSTDRTLSQLTQMLYGYNITLNLSTGKYTLIEGTGMTMTMEVFKSTDDYNTAYAKKNPVCNPRVHQAI